MPEIPDNIFREYDIRGTYGQDLTDETAELIGRAYAAIVRKTRPRKAGNPRITVGRDVRTSSAPLWDALIRGLTSSGIDCVDIGECPSPLQYFSIHSLGLDGGIMITGSHNPPEYNGFKISIGEETIHGEGIQHLKRAVRQIAPERPPEGMAEGKVERLDIISRYIDYVADNIRLPALKRPLKVALDSGNGTAGIVAPMLLRRLGCETVELFSDPDGRFPNHHPDPTMPENLNDLIEAVRCSGADFGVAYDGDADRIGVVDELGGIIWGDKLMVIFSRAILETNPGATIVGEVKCSQVMYDEIARRGGRPVMWKTGHSLIKSKMKELKAELAGEMSGHIFFANRYLGFDDAVYASCRLAEIMAMRREKDPGFAFSTLLAGLPETVITPEIRVDCPDKLKFGVIEKLCGAIGKGTNGFKVRDIIKIDGLRMNFDGGWALVRASNTQPVLVLRFEADSKALLDRSIDFVKTRLDKALPGVVFPV
ncbi:MAG: phosphomannomutase/phosphoglucomutase [Deltaproteobacteria bacterium]|nr:phosphomannomutase/phosphoglucomutase [Deltaproteobacteria bacterium]